MSAWSVSVCLAVTIAVSAAAGPCPYTECECSRNFINCHNKRMTTWPKLQPGNWAHNDLDAGGNNMATIDASQLPSSLEVITIQRTPITKIPDLSHLTKLYSMMLQFLNLDQIKPNDIFGPLPLNLKSLYITFSGLNCFPNLVFSDGTYDNMKLEVLELTGNNITEAMTDKYMWPSSLKELSLGVNKISRVERIMFGGNNKSSLQKLDLSNNPITYINVFAFVNVTQLTELNLAGVQLTSLPLSLTKLPNLNKLWLSGKQMDCSCPAGSGLGSWAASRPALQIVGCTSAADMQKCPGGVVG